MLRSDTLSDSFSFSFRNKKKSESPGLPMTRLGLCLPLCASGVPTIFDCERRDRDGGVTMCLLDMTSRSTSGPLILSRDRAARSAVDVPDPRLHPKEVRSCTSSEVPCAYKESSKPTSDDDADEDDTDADEGAMLTPTKTSHRGMDRCAPPGLGLPVPFLGKASFSRTFCVESLLSEHLF